MGLNKDLGFSAADRTENIRRIGEASKLFADAGILCLNSFISPYSADRDMVRHLHDAGNLPFIEVFVDVALEVAEKRDPKGLYKKARAGKIKNFTGIDDPYEAPINPEIYFRTDQMTLDEEVNMIMAVLHERGLLSA
jgi:adenylylsulfate kinase